MKVLIIHYMIFLREIYKKYLKLEDTYILIKLI